MNFKQGLIPAGWVGALLFAGCQSDPGRIPSAKVLAAHLGKWTYDDALMELGAPAASLELRDHSRIVEWAAGFDDTPALSFRLESASGSRRWTEAGNDSSDSGRLYRQLQFDQAGKLVEIRDVRR